LDVTHPYRARTHVRPFRSNPYRSPDHGGSFRAGLSCLLSCVWDAFAGSSIQHVKWFFEEFKDEEISMLVEVLGDRRQQIREVSLSGSEITEKSLSLISKRMKNVNKIDLSHCRQIKFENLTAENNNNRNNDNSSSQVETILHGISTLSDLNLSRTSINDLGVEQIVSAFSSSLTFLNLSRNSNISDVALSKIKAKMPNCEVLADG
jgi:hypothetical protein